MFPLESAEENIRRLAFDKSIVLPYPEADPTREVQQTAVQCPNCPVKFCSNDCLARAEAAYHKVMCASLQPNQPFAQINEIWK